MIILALGGGLVIGGVAAWLVLKGRNERLSALLESEQLQRQQLLRERQEAQAAQVAEREKAQATERNLYAELARLQSERAAFEQQIASLKESAEQERTDRQAEFEQHLALVKERLQNETRELVEAKLKSMSASNTESISSLMKPYHERMQELREAVHASREKSIEQASAIGKQIEAMMQSSARLGTEADKLASALKFQPKVQGNFGESMLAVLLENSGLAKGVGYELQMTLKDGHGKTLRTEDDSRLVPDAVIHFPDKRDVYIDSKMQYPAWLEYCNAESEEVRAEAVKALVKSIRDQVSGLSSKNYPSYRIADHTPLPYVIMYIPFEGAMQLAMSADPALWSWAFRTHKVFLTSEQNLLLVLQLLNNAWVQQQQVENHAKVYEIAGDLLDRTEAFLEQFGKIGKAYEDARTKLAGQQGLKTSVRKLVDLGARPKKKSITSLAEHLDEE